MASPPRNLPALPLEVIEQIIGFHGELEDEEWREDFDEPTAQRNHSEALLACHMVSKQFRVCALRLICRKTFINLDDTPERLRRLQDVLSVEIHSLSQLYSPPRFIKEIVIFLTDHKINIYNGYTVPKETIASVLKTVADKVPMEILSIFGSTTRAKAYWGEFAVGPDITHAIEAIIRLPSVTSLYIRAVGQMPYELAGINTHLHSFSISRSEYFQKWSEVGITPPPSFSATLPKLENLTIHRCDQLPQGLQLPSVRIIDAKYQYLSESETVWGVIQRSSQTLTSISIQESPECYDPTFPKNLDLSSFPHLETFVFSYFCAHSNERLGTLEEVGFFFDIKRPIPNLRTIELCVFLDGEDQFHNDFFSRIGKAYPWGTLDKALANGFFIGIESVCITLELTFSKEVVGQSDDTVNLDDIVKMLHSDIMDSFSRSKTLIIPLEVDVDVTLF